MVVVADGLKNSPDRLDPHVTHLGPRSVRKVFDSDPPSASLPTGLDIGRTPDSTRPPGGVEYATWDDFLIALVDDAAA
jgi:hypothetical protein